MSLSNEWTERHLTPAGWVEGTEKLDFSKKEVPPPQDRVLTCVYRDYQSHWAAKPEQTVREQWRAADADDRIAELLERYGPCPEHL